MIKIKPCPFCGCEVRIIPKGIDSLDISCKKRGCWLEFGANWNYKDKNILIKRWNDSITNKRYNPENVSIKVGDKVCEKFDKPIDFSKSKS